MPFVTLVALQPLELVGKKYLLSGEVHIDSALYALAHLLGDSLVIKVQGPDGQELELDNPARLISEPNDDYSYAVYEYSHWAELGEELIFSAHHGRCDQLPDVQFLCQIRRAFDFLSLSCIHC